MTEPGRQHWLVGIVRKLALPGAQQLDAAPDLPLRDAWGTVASAVRMSDADLAEAVAKHFRLVPAALDVTEPRALKLIPEAIARRFGAVPLRESDRQLIVATSNPNDMDAEQALSFTSGRTVVFEIASPSAIQQAIDERYSPDRVVETLLDTVGGGGNVADEVQLIEEIAPQGGSAADAAAKPVVKLTNLILQEAVTERASDIHIEPGPTGGLVRLRVDGVLRHKMQIPMVAFNRIVSRIKVVGKLDIADRIRPQDGRARIKVHGKLYDLRISTVPTRETEKVVIRILDPDGTPPLDQLGMAPPELARIRQLLRFRDGIILVTGPTGSGKTTTLYGVVRELVKSAINLMTVEDPIEYELQGVTQIQVENKRAVTFASALRAVLRQDPDVIFVGEIRDLETAETAVHAAMTGHLVLASLHTNDAVSVVQRLVDIGLHPTSIAGSLRGVVGQRLLRRVCEECGQTKDLDPLTPTEVELSGVYGARPTVRAVGCKRCGMSGYRGRMAVAEVLMTSAAMADGIAKNLPVNDLQRQAVADGMRPMREVALETMRAGITTLDEVERVIGEATAPQPVTAPPPHVLVVDDDAVTRKLARTFLEKIGLRVTEVEDGQAALAMVNGSGDVALVVLDLQMPEVDGLEVLRQIRGNGATAGLPVLVLTGSEEHADEAEIMDSGADDYIRKPIDRARFTSRVKAVLRRAGG